MSHAFNRRLPSKYFLFLIIIESILFFFLGYCLSVSNWQYAWLTRGHDMTHMSHECIEIEICVKQRAHMCPRCSWRPYQLTDSVECKRETCLWWNRRMDGVAGVHKCQMDIDSRSIRMRFALNVCTMRWQPMCGLIKSSATPTTRIAYGVSFFFKT